ncbi:hypothetical protein BG015_002660, partial [Linnemannia schmuckeri]
ASSGPFSQSRIAHCAASNADGSLVAVFSGFLNGATTADPNVYILNTITWTWTAIPLASGRGRGNAACTIVDDTFIIWGGFYNNPSVEGGLPSGLDNLLLLSLSTGQWKTSYTPSTTAGGTGSGGGGSGNGGMGGNGGNGTGKGGLSGGAIGGICAGVAVVIAAVAFLFFRRTWKKGDDAVAASSSSKLESGSHAAPCTGGAPGGAGDPTNGHGHHHNGGAGPAAVVVAGAAGHIPTNHHSPLSPPSSTTVSPTVYDQSLYHQQQPQPQPQQVGYTGYEQHQQQYPPYLQQAPDHTFHHRPSTEVAYSSGVPGEGVQYVDENGHLYRRSYQPEVVPAPVPSPGTVYYPPPPSSGASMGTPEQGAYQVAHGQGQGVEAPYKASIGEGGVPKVDSSSYHDSYGVAGSATGAATTGSAKRPVGGPQGGPFVEVSVVKGAPQAIPQ